MAPTPATPGARVRFRPLTLGEWDAVSPGLARALREAGAAPRLEPRAHPAARVAALWRRGTPILTRGEVIWWPAAPADLSAPGRERGMAVLQHELQHVLDYASGWLTALRYLARARHWTYRWRLSADATWDAFGAEQRAAMAEHLWLMERGLAPDQHLAALRRLIPWV
ncbi:MAG: hypothetical protein JWO83_187 [Caulobacteraceae bacterium]|nr:hypothetical protein [Caulobacteraceae bacterium]